MATTADFKNGLCIKHNGDLWKIESFQHVKPGKGPAFVRTKIRNLNTSRMLENTFTAGVKIEIVRIENRSYQFLYQEGNETYHFMNQKNYEQIAIQKNLINAPQYLKEGSIVDNCPEIWNPGQIDSDADGVGDSCEDSTFLIEDQMVYSIFPNPFSDYTTIKFANGIHDRIDIQIFESSGRLVYETYTNTNFIKIYKSNFSIGLYIIEMSQENLSARDILIIQ